MSAPIAGDEPNTMTTAVILYRSEKLSILRGLFAACICAFIAYVLFASWKFTYAAQIAFGFWSAVMLWFIAGLHHRTVVFDRHSRKVIIENRSRSGRLVKKAYVADKFIGVISHYPMVKNAPNRVSLVGSSHDDQLLIGSFQLTYRPAHFWYLFPEIVETEGATALRKRLISELGVMDGGFVGNARPPYPFRRASTSLKSS